MVLKTGLDYLDELSRDASGDRELQRELAGAYARIGDVKGSVDTANLGDIAGALDSYGKARKLLDAVLDRSPGDRQAELQRLKVIQQTGMVESIKLGSGHAADTYQEGLRRAEAALVRYPGDLEFEERLADLCELASRQQRVSGDSQSALANGNRGLKLLLHLRSAKRTTAISSANWPRSTRRSAWRRSGWGSSSRPSNTIARTPPKRKRFAVWNPRTPPIGASLPWLTATSGMSSAIIFSTISAIPRGARGIRQDGRGDQASIRCRPSRSTGAVRLRDDYGAWPF